MRVALLHGRGSRLYLDPLVFLIFCEEEKLCRVRTLQVLGQSVARDIDGVQHVVDVAQHACGDFCYTGLMWSTPQFLVNDLHFLLGLFRRRNILNGAKNLNNFYIIGEKGY